MKTQIEKELLQEIISQLKAFQAGLYFDSKDDVIKRAEKLLEMTENDVSGKEYIGSPTEGFEIRLMKNFASQKGVAILMLHPDDFEIIAKRYMKPTEKDNIKKFEEINDKLPNE